MAWGSSARASNGWVKQELVTHCTAPIKDVRTRELLRNILSDDNVYGAFAQSAAKGLMKVLGLYVQHDQDPRDPNYMRNAKDWHLDGRQWSYDSMLGYTQRDSRPSPYMPLFQDTLLVERRQGHSEELTVFPEHFPHGHSALRAITVEPILPGRKTCIEKLRDVEFHATINHVMRPGAQSGTNMVCKEIQDRFQDITMAFHAQLVHMSCFRLTEPFATCHSVERPVDADEGTMCIMAHIEMGRKSILVQCPMEMAYTTKGEYKEAGDGWCAGFIFQDDFAELPNSKEVGHGSESDDDGFRAGKDNRTDADIDGESAQSSTGIYVEMANDGQESLDYIEYDGVITDRALILHRLAKALGSALPLVERVPNVADVVERFERSPFPPRRIVDVGVHEPDPRYPESEPNTRCYACGRNQVPLQVCSRCRVRKFCSIDCMAAAWSQGARPHKHECNMFLDYHQRLWPLDDDDERDDLSRLKQLLLGGEDTEAGELA